MLAVAGGIIIAVVLLGLAFLAVNMMADSPGCGAALLCGVILFIAFVVF